MKQKMPMPTNKDIPHLSTPKSVPFYPNPLPLLATTELTNMESEKIQDFQAGLEGLIQLTAYTDDDHPTSEENTFSIDKSR